MAYPSRNTNSYSSSSKNSSSSTLVDQILGTWNLDLNTWNAELRTWNEVVGSTWSYQTKN